MSEDSLQNLNDINGELHDRWCSCKGRLLSIRDASLALGTNNAVVDTIESVIDNMAEPMSKLDKCVGAVISDSVHNAELSAQNTLAACLAGITHGRESSPSVGSTDDDDSDRNSLE